ncbi:MAG: hypothetical protein H6Q26_1234 [Bacteroidetes bacterium]|uniref:hypothetical protein n=1 Tax=[Flexibacter] sp. ATCC 35208 TaxID=1936242 RepID=UPI0009D564DB|nr:hypothetical protein [[Flexibacter] sp. ATCC 35208]MBP1651077.1 hypothetical protein [Bacteroidota bacterium]OMP75936.1 hypothetical protein BW716_27340 [[Flexibacter] sp. ATCC 35208]
MNKTILASVFSIAIFFAACKSKTTSENADSSATTTTTTPSEEKATPANEPKSYTVTFSPDTAFLGKKKEAFIRLKNGKAVELYDNEGKVTGTELTYEIELTNKNKVGESSVFINPNDFRLTLDNGTNITHDNYNSVSADAESTKSSEENKFRLPAGTKPKTLNLFLDETRVSVGVEMK